MKIHVLRLRPDQDLKEEIATFSNLKKIKAGFILTAVGSLKKATLRLANENIIKVFHKKFEITSLSGTLSPDGVHLHLSLSDESGKSFGGHLKEGCTIYTTAEIIIGETSQYLFSRKFDAQTGFKELNFKSLKK
jgi:predicted DNA-binding protein with PD1-like motif